MTAFGQSDTRSYNALGQLTGIADSSIHLQYAYPASTNNGKISQMTNAATGEIVTYTYDSLLRLVNASSTSNWSDAYVYDGYGNLTETPAARGYNNFSYDLANRLTSAPGANYAYNPANQRVWRFTSANNYDEYAVYGLDGHRLTTYKIIFTPPDPHGEYNAYATVTAVDSEVYFASRLIAHGPGALIYAAATDNIGSVRQDLLLYPSSTASNFFPWGEEQTSTPNDRVKFATYRRDSESGLDYAWNRSYNNTIARFMSPDPYGASAQPSNPQSWNRYAYVLNDPIGNNDPTGQDYCLTGGDYGNEGLNPYTWIQLPGNCYGFAQFYANGFGFAGGGKGVFRVTVTGYSRGGAPEETIAADLSKILGQVLNGSFAKWLTGPDFSASDFIKAITGSGPSNYSFGYGALNDNLIAAFVGTVNPDGSPISGLPTNLSPGPTITVNTDGAFFNPAYSVGSGFVQYQGGTLQAQLFVLIHELAHEVGAVGFKPDAGSQANENSNNALVQKNCGKQIASAK